MLNIFAKDSKIEMFEPEAEPVKSKSAMSMIKFIPKAFQYQMQHEPKTFSAARSLSSQFLSPSSRWPRRFRSCEYVVQYRDASECAQRVFRLINE
jgi:hypothetical protein